MDPSRRLVKEEPGYTHLAGIRSLVRKCPVYAGWIHHGGWSVEEELGHTYVGLHAVAHACQFFVHFYLRLLCLEKIST